MDITPQYWEYVTNLCSYLEPLIALSFTEALEEFNKEHASTMYLYNKSDMASNMHAHVRGRIRFNFQKLPWAHVIDDEPGKNAFMLLISGSVIGIPIFIGIKFKKQGYGFRTSNIQTEAVKNFAKQHIEYTDYLPHIQVALPIPDVKDKVKNPPRGNNVIAGYTPVDTWAQFKKLTFTMPFGGRKIKLISEITVLDLEEVSSATPRRTEEAPQTERIRRRRDASKKQEPRKFIAASTGDEGIQRQQEPKKKKQNE